MTQQDGNPDSPGVAAGDGTDSLPIDEAPMDIIVEDLQSAQTRPPTLEEMKETSAKTVALVLVWSFAGTILLTFLLACIITAISRGSSETAKVFSETCISLFEALGKFVSPVFGPLLAFVLGYYFSKEKRHESREQFATDRWPTQSQPRGKRP